MFGFLRYYSSLLHACSDLVWNDNIYYNTLFHLTKRYVDKRFMLNHMKDYDYKFKHIFSWLEATYLLSGSPTMWHFL